MMSKIAHSELSANRQTLEKLLDERPVLWVGAGTSIAAGYPSTWDLMQAMREKSMGDILDDLTFTELADAFIQNNGRGELSQLLQKRVGISRDPTPTLRAIARLLEIHARDD